MLSDSLTGPSPKMSSGVEDTGEWDRVPLVWTGMLTSVQGAQVFKIGEDFGPEEAEMLGYLVATRVVEGLDVVIGTVQEGDLTSENNQRKC